MARSRGLGDVYKRQIKSLVNLKPVLSATAIFII
jgi:hypothetical protein